VYPLDKDDTHENTSDEVDEVAEVICDYQQFHNEE